MASKIDFSGMVAKNVISGKSYAVPSGAMVKDVEALRIELEKALAYTTYNDIVAKWNKASDSVTTLIDSFEKGKTTAEAVEKAKEKRALSYLDVVKARACIIGVEFDENNIDELYTEENNKLFDNVWNSWLGVQPFAVLCAFCMTGTKSVNTAKLEATISDNLGDVKSLNKALNNALLPLLKSFSAVKPFTSGITANGYDNLLRVRDTVKRTWTDKGIKNTTTKKRELLRQTLLTAFEVGYNLQIATTIKTDYTLMSF